jgi:hypothetical protein
MALASWEKQSPNKPLFPNLAWSRPENRQQAGKLLIVGGNLYGFTAPASAYGASQKAGIGVCRVVLPDALKKTVGKLLDGSEFVPSTPSGSFAIPALASLLDLAQWADGVLVAGDLGRNSETAILLEQFLQKTDVPLVLTKDTADYISSSPQIALRRQKTVLILSLSQLQRLVVNVRHREAVTFSMDMIQLVNWLQTFTSEYTIGIIVKHLDKILVAINGRVSAMTLSDEQTVWRVPAAAYATVWWLQNPGTPFEALSAGIYDLYGQTTENV